MAKPTITRQKHGKGFSYYLQEKLVRDKSELAYLRSLAVPPAWNDVRISTNKRAKILASGIDTAGRQQAIYHPDFRSKQDKAKFERILNFGEHLPKMRRQVEHDLSRKRLRKEKVLACVVKLMDEAYFRVGNEQYAKEHGHYGITTLRSKHADITSNSVTFNFVGKSGQEHHKKISDRQLAHIIKQLDDLPGYEIFKYVDADGQTHNLDSSDVNAYIKDCMGEAYSAKDFRTWGGTLLAAANLANLSYENDRRQRRKQVTSCIRRVARKLGNTPAVTRSSYIDPRVLHAFEDNELLKVKAAVNKLRPRKYMKPEERFVLHLLQRSM